MSLINAFNNVTEQSLVLTKEYLEVTPSLSSVGIYGWNKEQDKGNTDEGNTVKVQFVNDRGVKYDFSYHVCKIESVTKCYGYVTSWSTDITKALDNKYYESWAYHIEQTISNLKEFTFVSNNYEKLCFTSYNDGYLPEYDSSNYPIGYASGFDDRKIPQFTAYNRTQHTNTNNVTHHNYTYVQSLTNEDIKNGFVVIKL
jgi:hypothetical protein